MKVLLSAYACVPGRGSEPGNGWNWAYHLALQGLEVHLITTSRGKEEIGKMIANENMSNIHVHFVDHAKFWGKAYYWNFILMYVAYYLWQKKILKKATALHTMHQFEVVHHVTWGSVKIGSALYKLKNTKFVFGPVGGGHEAPKIFKKYFYNEWSKEAFRNRAGKIIARVNPLTKPTLRNAGAVLATNLETLVYAQSNGARNPILLVDSALRSDYIPRETSKRMNSTIQLLWVGRMYAFKGIGLVLEGLSKLESDIKKKVHLNVVGNGPFMSGAERLIERLGVKELVTLHGQVPYLQVKELYKASDIFIFCSLRDSCPAQHLEAMAHGLPVITLNIHGSKLVVPDAAGIKVPVDKPHETVEQIALAIKMLITDPAKRNKMSLSAYDYAKNQTWDKKVKYILEHCYS